MWRFIRLLERLGLAPARPATAIESLESALQAQELAERTMRSPDLPQSRVLLTDTPIYGQLHPESPLLAELNRPGTMPSGVACHTLFGDIRYSIRISANRLTLIDKTVSFGDLIVSAASAHEIPHAPGTAHPFLDGYSITMTLHTKPASPEPRSLLDHVSPISHNVQLANPDFQKVVLSILAS